MFGPHNLEWGREGRPLSPESLLWWGSFWDLHSGCLNGEAFMWSSSCPLSLHLHLGCLMDGPKRVQFLSYRKQRFRVDVNIKIQRGVLDFGFDSSVWATHIYNKGVNLIIDTCIDPVIISYVCGFRTHIIRGLTPRVYVGLALLLYACMWGSHTGTKSLDF